MNDPTVVDQIIASAKSAASNLRVRSALNPMLWLSGILRMLMIPEMTFLPSL
jgi:hypothetical protein